MALNRSLTSANARFMLSIAGLFTIPQKLEGYAAEDIFDSEAVVPVETSMGLDGILSAGFVPVAIKMNVTLQANSPSVDVFEAWYNAMQVAREIYSANAIVNIGSLGRTYTCINGQLTSYTPLPDAKKILQPRRFQITWEAVAGVPV